MKKEWEAIVKEVEQKTGYLFDKSEVNSILDFTIRKCEINKKSLEYIPILFENELRDYISRLAVNIASPLGIEFVYSALSV